MRVLDRLEVMVEGPVGEVDAEVAGGDIGEAEVDAQPYSCVDDVGAYGPSAVVVTDGSGYGCRGQRDVQVPAAEEVLQRARYGARRTAL